MKTLLLFSLGGTLLAGSLSAQSPELQSAVQPLDDGVPQVAVVRLQALLATKLSALDRQLASAKLGEALLAANQPEEALKLLEDPSLRDLPGTKFFRAQALAAEGKWSEALPLYQSVRDDSATNFRVEAIVGEAEAYRSLGQLDQALAAFALLNNEPRWKTRAHFRSAELYLAKRDPEMAMKALAAAAPASPAERKEQRFLRGRAESQLGHRKKAMDLFAWVLKHPEGATHPVLIATLFAMADEHLAARTPDAGDDFLEDFVEHHPADEALPEVFAKLEQLYLAEKKQARHDLGRWSHDSAEPRRALAQWYLARAEMRLGRPEVARQIFTQLRAQHPPLPALADAFLQSAQSELNENRFDQALAFLETARALAVTHEVRNRIDFLAGEAQYRAGRFPAAAQIFGRAASESKAQENDSLINVAFSYLAAGDEKKFEVSRQELKERGADPSTQGELVLEKGLAEAAAGKDGAARSLQNFIHDFPQHPRISEAWVALAELAFHGSPPRLEEARQDLARAAASHSTADAEERADYLTIWLEDSAAQPNESKVIERATEFLQQHPASRLVAEVRLKLAEAFYGGQDFASARTQFTLLAQQNPDSALAEKAQFFAAESAMRSMGSDSLERALLLFGEVVKKNGEMKWAARCEQAVIERKLGKPADAITLYDEVLKGDGKAGEKREALCGKGDILYDLGATAPENFRGAIEVYEKLAAETEAGTHWHNQALFKKGVCQEKLNAPTEALSTFYQIIEDGSRPDRRREFFWFYKAGFNAARLLEEQANWKSAAAIYEKLAFAGGGRSAEASSRLNRIRLEHFLFDQ